MELGDGNTDSLLNMMEVDEIDIVVFALVMFVPQVVKDIEVSQCLAGVGVFYADAWVITEFGRDVELVAAELFFVEAEVEQQGSAFLGVVSDTDAYIYI